MFERYLTEAFTTHFGHFVQNLDSDKVRLSAWRGELILEDLCLRRNALDSILPECPLEIAYGKIGNLELRIPWKLLRSRVAWKGDEASSSLGSLGCSIVLSNVNILITPKRNHQREEGDREDEDEPETDQSPSLEERRIQKEHDVQQMMDATLLRRVAAGTNDEQQAGHKWAEWGRSLITNLLSTLSVTVRDIHVRYEDPGTCLGFCYTMDEQQHRPPFAVGITLRQFSVQTTGAKVDHTKEESTTETKADSTTAQHGRHKLVAAYQLAIYWDSESHLMMNNIQRKKQPVQTNSSAEELESFENALSDCDEATREDEDYYASAFQVLNNVGGYSFVHRKRFIRDHMYLLNPVSPSLHISLTNVAAAGTEEEESNADSVELSISPIHSSENSVTDSLPESPRGPLGTPLSAFALTCPPCQFGIGRSTLEDMVYIRKSLAVWKRSQKAHTYYATLRRLARLRPKTPPLHNPRSWWRYAMEATIILSRLENEVENTRKRGWLKFMHAFRRRRDYVRCYSELLSDSCETEKQERLHRSLLQMEDDLVPSEIVAFRIAVYEGLHSNLLDLSGRDTYASPSTEKEVAAAVTETAISLEHRLRMSAEMVEELDREKKEDMSVIDAVPPDPGLESHNEKGSVLFNVSATFSELCLEVNGQLPENDLHPSPPTGPLHLVERPIVRLSCAVIQRLDVMGDGSWEFESIVASFQLKDMTAKSLETALFTNLIGPKSRVRGLNHPMDMMSNPMGETGMVYIDGFAHRHSASVHVKRTFHRMEEKDPLDNQSNAEIVTGSTTHTKVVLSPFEIVYATDPVAALSHVFSTMKTPELVDDYYRMASVVMDWRTRQQQRLLAALAHRRKKIVVNVNIAAPVVLIPEDLHRPDSPLLVVDLGHLQFRNAPYPFLEMADYDDEWQLNLNNLQVSCSSISFYQREQASAPQADAFRRAKPSSPDQFNHLIEPFSLEFEISTIISKSFTNSATNQTRVHVSATLPRLVFNLTSSAVRLVLRLQHKWAQRKEQRMITTSSAFRSKTVLSTSASAESDRTPTHGTPATERTVFFLFSAPLIALKSFNDVDGRDCDQLGNITPLFDLAIRDIRGTFVQKLSSTNLVSNTFDAKLRCVDALDKYQRAGNDFSLLLSSLSPDFFVESDSEGELRQSFLQPEGGSASMLEQMNTDLVSVRYSSCRYVGITPPAEHGELIPDKLSLTFHELYVEWNPETIAAAQKAFRLPPDEEISTFATSHSIESSTPEEDSEDQFFDALEDDADIESSPDSDMYILSEISSSRSTSVSDLASTIKPHSFVPSAPPLTPAWSPRWNMPHNRSILGFAHPAMPHDGFLDQEGSNKCDSQADLPFPTPLTPFEVSFHLSKLKVNFNKESRHRRLLTAEMDGTKVRYLKTPSKGSKTTARIGNLTFSDPVKGTGETLYGEILGLKTHSSPLSSKSNVSLLEMELEMQPRIRRFASSPPHSVDGSTRYDAKRTKSCTGVTIDADNGQIDGFDGFIKLHFSPMRFVFLQQLWMEVIDYFFEGVLGNAVWGKRIASAAHHENNLNAAEPCSVTQALTSNFRRYLPGADAEGFNFTLFDVVMDAPVLLLPVTYRSPQYIRLEFAKAEFSNAFDGRIEGGEALGSAPQRMQWYNNCTVSFREIKMVGHCGTPLTRNISPYLFKTGDYINQPCNGDTFSAGVRVTWPMGQTARAVMPKWKVDCCFDSMSIVLRRADYALFQHILSYNLGESSRHFEEWKVLQNLPASELGQLKWQTMVHFGYDKKDTAPTTFDVDLSIPSISCFLSDDDHDTGSGTCFILEARFTDFNWSFSKHSDRISRQRITCNVALFQPTTNLNLLSPTDGVSGKAYQGRVQQGGRSSPQLTYTSSSRQSGDNVKTLEIAETRIYFAYPAWMTVKNFFENLPLPTTMTPQEIMVSVKIGDRWYPIAGVFDEQKKKHDTKIGVEERERHATKHPPCYHFRLILKSPHIILDSTSIELKPIRDENTKVVLSMSHLDYLHVNNGKGGKIQRSFFVHNLEVYSSSKVTGHRESYGAENSLIHPWCVSGLFERCNGQSNGICDEHSAHICLDVLRVRASYSDMSVAIDVFLSFLCDYRYVNNLTSTRHKEFAPQSRQRYGEDASDICDQQATPRSSPCRNPAKSSLIVRCDGFEVIVVDDSHRHFADAQKLVIFVLGDILFTREHHNQDLSDLERRSSLPVPSFGRVLDLTDETACLPICLTSLRLTSLDLFDCLQPPDSKFCLLASSRDTALQPRPLSVEKSLLHVYTSGKDDSRCRRMSWPEFAMAEDCSWGFAASPLLLERIDLDVEYGLQKSDNMCERTSQYPTENAATVSRKDLIEAQMIKGFSNSYDANLGSLSFQWNPSTVIALQRFLGRLKKEFMNKYDQLQNPPEMPPSPQHAGESSFTQETSFNATLVVESLSICLNKEHQNRRLLKATLSGSKLVVDHNNNSTIIDGSVEGLNAWDQDDYKARGFADMSENNRRFVSVINEKQMGFDEVSEPESKERNVFLKFRHETFWKFDPGTTTTGKIPNWVKSHLLNCGKGTSNIDDYLSVAVGVLQFTYIRERTEEILDYLSNGLPGKGMGATSRAAKGFIKKRIKTRSFLELTADAPQIRIPRHEGAESGVVLRLGDVCVKSWFDERFSDSVSHDGPSKTNADPYHDSTSSKQWWRVLSLSLQGMGCSTFENSADNASAINLPLDLSLVIRKPTWRERTLSMQGKLSYVDLTLKYTDYALLRAVTSDNLSRDIDVSRWDNVEKAYWMEEAYTNFSSGPGPVLYAADARFIRYGKKAGMPAKNLKESAEGHQGGGDSSRADDMTSIDVKFDVDGLYLTLHRDDKVNGFCTSSIQTAALGHSFDYDIVLFRVRRIVISVATNSTGEKSFELSLHRMELIDLGDVGRLARESHYQYISDHIDPKGQTNNVLSLTHMREPCAFCILAEGYSHSESGTDSRTAENEITDVDPQVVLTVERVPGASVGTNPEPAADRTGSKITMARVVINYLSINALIRPLREIVSFITCSWSSGIDNEGLCRDDIPQRSRVGIVAPPYQQKTGNLSGGSPGSTGFQLKVVANFPRIFFVADESDPHSRALVLRGFAVLNASQMKQSTSLCTNEVESHLADAKTTHGAMDTTTTRALDVHLHGMETYINPDVDSALGRKPYHTGILSGNSRFEISDEREERDTTLGHNSVLGVALIQPVTVGMEYLQVQRDRFPTHRTACMDMESVSTMLSFEDLSLVEAVLNRWSSGRKVGNDEHRSAIFGSSKEHYDVPASVVSDGVVLSRNRGDVVVASVHDTEKLPDVNVGDSLVSINGEKLSLGSLREVTELFQHARASDTATFRRALLACSRSQQLPVELPRSSDEGGQDEKEASAASDDENASTKESQKSNYVCIDFHVGKPHGLSIERSACGNVPVITSVSSSVFEAIVGRHIGASHQIFSRDEDVPLDVSIPKPGAIIVCLNGVVSADLGYKETASLLEDLSGNLSSMDSFRDSASTSAEKTTYSMTFLQMDSSDWGCVDQLDVTVKDLSLTFIDDFQGKDMPIFRANLNAVGVHMGRGLGIATSSIEVEAPTILTALRPRPVPNSSMNAGMVQRRVSSQVSSETILKVHVIGRTKVDYYHSRVAAWEPLLEVCQLCFLIERQPGSGSRSGHLSIEFSDRLLHDGIAPTFPALKGDMSREPESVCLNFTDAVAEVAVRAVAEWKEWRESTSDVTDDSVEMVRSLQGVATRQDAPEDCSMADEMESPSDSSQLLFPDKENDRIQDQDLVRSILKSGNSSPSSRQVTSNLETQDASPRRAAARKVAQVALQFAQKRGAETHKKGNVAEPFVFRNRTGIPASFFQEKQNRKSNYERRNRGGSKSHLKHRFSASSRSSSSFNFTEVSDGRDARFHIDMTEEVSSVVLSSEGVVSQSSESSFKKVRAYDGQLPHLTVVLKTADGVQLDPICNLPLFKVGSSVRRLRIHRDGEACASSTNDLAEAYVGGVDEDFSVAVVWTVEIENNRRILTLSSAVSIMSYGIDTTIEVGVRRIQSSEGKEGSIQCHDDDGVEPKTSVMSVGYARPGTPLYLPLQLSLKFEKVSVYVRPVSKNHHTLSSASSLLANTFDNFYSWSRESILEFVPSTNSHLLHAKGLRGSGTSESGATTKWIWRETFRAARTVHCNPVEIRMDTIPSVFLSCYVSTQTSGIGHSISTDMVQSSKPERAKRDFQKVLAIGIDGCLSLRNMLPLSLEWEIAHRTSHQSPASILDGSSVRHQNLKEHGFVPLSCETPDDKCELVSGGCTEVFACELAKMNVLARFRCNSNQNWSSWAWIGLPSPYPVADVPPNNETPHTSRKKNKAKSSEGVSRSYRPRQLNVQIRGDFGDPLTIGVRLFPKLVKASIDEGAQDVFFGIEAVVHAELWLRNLTSLKLAFGCPTAQIHFHQQGELGDGDELNDEVASKVAAEAALMEIAGVLEFGDRGVVLDNPREDVARAHGDLHLLPYQSSFVCEEVFEYIEIESSTVRRRWWASEKHDSCRQKPSDSDQHGSGWYWVDSCWMIDCTGQAKSSEGGWESCRNLVGGKGNTFSAMRTFNPSHPFRRRRWFRRRAPLSHLCTEPFSSSHAPEAELCNSSDDQHLLEGLNAFHQPIVDSFSRVQQELEHKARIKNNQKGKDKSFRSNGSLSVSIKCGDGEWSMPAVIPDRGQAHGVFRVLASRWPALTKTSRVSLREKESPDSFANGKEVAPYPFTPSDAPQSRYEAGSLAPEVYELCYHVKEFSGDWDEFSRLMLVTPRYMLRNDSKKLTMEVKQAGAQNVTTTVLKPGEAAPFYWADIRLPELVSVRPLVDRFDGTRYYRWSGGVDICNLGMAPIRVRRSRMPHPSSPDLRLQQSDHGYSFKLKSVRVAVEIRPGTGGTGINVSFKEENWNGDGSLFRVENLSPFPVWLAQDGVLANPAATLDQLRAAQRQELHAPNGLEDHAEVDGDLINPMSQTSFALDVPFRQGKYAGRRSASMAELLRVRAALAPLSSREGIESTKVIGFTNVGRCLRLNPGKLTSTLSEEVLSVLKGVRVLGVVTTDGPTRVLRFSLMQTTVTGAVFGRAFAESTIHRKAPYGTSSSFDQSIRQATVDGAVNAVALVRSKSLLSENDAKREGFFGGGIEEHLSKTLDVEGSSQTTIKESHEVDLEFSFRASFGAFVFSLVDSTPSEIAVLSLRSVHALASWNTLRTSEASAMVSVGWLQVDNHVPNAPFPVAICRDDETREVDDDDDGNGGNVAEGTSKSFPLLLIGLTFAPKHKSGILCLRSATIYPRDLAVAVDLASIVRFLNFIEGIKKHASQSQPDGASSGILSVPSVLDENKRKHSIRIPDVEEMCMDVDGAGAVGVESQKLYFEGLTILPCRVSFSVAPSRALTMAQASLEGRDAAAIHAAVRKGDVLIGNGGSVLGVHVGGKNQTALAVVRGVFKSIIVDALLRCDGASMNFSGVLLRHHISSGPQLITYLTAHYLQSLRQNVPALIGSLAAFGNPLGLIRGLGDGVSDFGSETVKGLKKSVKELDPTFAVDGVARGTESLARHAVGGFADSASLLTETFSKNMAVLTLDRRYAQRRDRGNTQRREGEFSTTFVEGVESGVAKLVQGFLEGVTGVVRAPIRGAEKRGMEGFAKGIGKGLLGLLVKPMIGLSDAATDVMLGVKGSVEGSDGTLQRGTRRHQQIRPRRPTYGRDSTLRPYNLADAAASALMLRTRVAGEKFLSHCDLEDRVALLSVKRLLLLGSEGEELLMVKFRHIKSVKVRQSNVRGDGASGWKVIIVLHSPRANGSEVEVISCEEKAQAEELSNQIQRGINLFANDAS